MIFCDYCTYLLIAVLIALPFLYKFSAQFRYYFKFLLFYISVGTSVTLCIPILIWRIGNPRNGLVATLPLRVVGRLFGLKWKIEGIEHLTPDRAAIVVSNHQSSLDILLMAYMCPGLSKVAAIAKKELFYIMPFALCAWLCGAHYIDRSNPQKSKDSMNAALNYCKDNKVKLWIFPEGTRNMNDEMLGFKKGAFHLAISGQIPILPIVSSSYKGFLNHRLKVWNPGNIVVTALPEIKTEGLTIEDLPKLIEEVREKMMKTFTNVSSQVMQPFPLTHEQEKEN